ncbi:MAG TPA: hypothetical protein VG457_05680 [Planctomycetota bacterium]|nr:hypothetical protein [Planctomycetota bacterium]
MTTTKRYRVHSARSPDKNPPPDSGGPGELQFRIVCKGKSIGEVLDALVRSLSEAESQNRDPLIVLEDLGSLAGSLTSLIKGLSRLLVGYPRMVTLWESSGFTEAFLSAMEPPRSPRPVRDLPARDGTA